MGFWCAGLFQTKNALLFKGLWSVCFFFFLNVFERILLCLLSMNLFDQNIFKYYYYLKLLYILKCMWNFLWWQTWIFSIITHCLQCHMILQKSF